MTCKTLETSPQSFRRQLAPRAKKKLSAADKKRKARTFKYLSMWDGIYNKWSWTDKTKAEKRELRHGINIDLFGEYIPPSRLDNEQFTIMRYALELLYNEGILVWSKEVADLAREEGLRRIYTWWIEHAGLDVEGITEYGAPEISDWRILDSKRLWQLFITIKNRVKAAKKRGVSLWENSESEPETSNNCPF